MHAPTSSAPVVRVLKLGGRVQSDPRLPRAIADAVRRGDRVCVVHGGGDELSALQRRLGLTPVFHNGRRVTSDEDIALARMVLSGVANKRLVAALLSAGVAAVGISGEDASLVVARIVDRQTFGAVGAPSAVDTAVLAALWGGGFVPVLSPLARDEASGDALNVNGDDAAAAIAAALGAQELLLVSDVPGVLAGGAVVPRLDAEQVAAMMADGTATGGMIAKLEAAQRALAAGVASVRIGDLDAIADAAAGTRLVSTLTPVAA
jgi:acetylglutamate kinase